MPDDRPDIFPLVHADLEARNAKGRETYGGTLRPFDGRDSALDLYEEILDSAVYQRKLLLEREEALAALDRFRAAYNRHEENMADLLIVEKALGGGR